MNKKMRQAEMISPGNIEIKRVDIPEIGKDEVLLKVMRIGICGSDIHVFHGRHPYTSYPVVQGHEVSCVVSATGKDVQNYKPGDKVTIEPQVSCGKCYPCTHGVYNICDNLKVLGFQTTGTASDYFAAPAAKLVKLPDTMDLNHGAMIEPLAVAVRAVKKSGTVVGKKVLVFGAGTIGNLVAQTAKAFGAEEVMVCDINDLRLEKATKCGVTHIVNSGKEDLKQAVESSFGAFEMADIIFECAGAGAAIESAVTLARKGTPIIVVGVFGERIPMDMALVNENELTLIGTARYVMEDFETAIELVSTGEVKLFPLITDEFDFMAYSDAYKRIDEYRDSVMKVIIKVND